MTDTPDPGVRIIETWYAGCRFRSRLEARWAVFFDHLGIEWEHEAQGVVVSHRLTLAEGSFTYLPDFWLPGEHLWVEVKGSLTDADCLRLLDAAASLSSNDGGGCHDRGGHDVLVLGRIPRPPTAARTPSTPYRLPVQLHMHKGDLEASAWPVHGAHGAEFETVARDVGGHGVAEECGYTLSAVAKLLVGGMSVTAPPSTRLTRAFTAARSARFEHGESG